MVTPPAFSCVEKNPSLFYDLGFAKSKGWGLMSSYKQHTQFNLFIALPLLLVGVGYFIHPHLYLMITFAASFIYATLFMNPDLDLANQIRLFSLRGILSLPFRSYARCFSHRGLSHHLIFGSLSRILWLACWATLIFLLCYKTLPKTNSILSFYTAYKPYLLYGFAGICIADWCHLLLDYKSK